MSWLLDFLTKYRSWVIVLFVLPVGFIFDWLVWLQRFLVRNVFSRKTTHEDRVKEVQEQVQEWAQDPNRKPMCTDRSAWINLSTRFFNKKECRKIRVSHLYNILSLDTKKQTVWVEPLVTVGEATAFLNPKGWTLEVTLEIMDATVGGLALATGMTTHSHRAGLMHETVVAYDVVLADGSLVRASKDENPDLFYALPWSHGTLGFVVALEVRIIPVKPYVRLEYIPFHSQKEYCEAIRRESITEDNPADFLELTIFSRETAVLTKGYFADIKNNRDRAKKNSLGLWYKPWWFKHVETFLRKGKTEEFIPLRHYLLRHNRSIFWVAADMITFGNYWLFRLLLGWLCPPKVAFLKFTTTEKVREMTFTHQVFQDITLPISSLEESISLTEELFELYPLLVYPCRIYDHTDGKTQHQGQLRPPRPSEIVPGTNFGMFYDLGVYGVPGQIKNKKPYNPTYAYRSMEHFIRKVGGYPFLYADTFMTEDEFEEMFDLTLYKQVRERYGCERAFPTLYKKIKPEVDVVAIGERVARELAK